MLTAFVNWVRGRAELLRVGVAAAISTLLAWLTYEIIYFLNPLEPHATTSWAIAFLIGIFRQHHLHRTLSFPATTTSYQTSLRREILASLVVLLAGSSVNFVLTESFAMHHRLAWVLCLLSVAGLEYALMKFFVFRRFSPGPGNR